ncbi:MAG TPA: ABC transporter permease, partial [Candidatus Synoicihabitans sp.]|nr:ABC transporter permease [Candidatus Synoicihabitans sp.]
MHDLRYAFRQLVKTPGFTLVAVATLALGIGLNTSMFSLMNMLLLQPLPFPERDQLVRVYRTTPQSQTANHTAPDSLELMRETSDFAEMAAYRQWSLSLAAADRPPVNLNVLRVTAGFFSVLGVQPELGRVFTPEEDRPGSNVVILSHATWQAQFGGDPAVVGSVVRIDGSPTTIIGVMPASFASILLWGPGDAFRPMAFTDVEKLDRKDSSVALLARHRRELSLSQVNARLDSLAARLAEHRPREQNQDGLAAVTLQSTTSNSGSRGISWLLLGLAGFVLLIACANLANLQLARAVARTHEFAVRAALGATRARLLGPLLCESLLLSLTGGLLGILIATWANDWIASQLSANGLVTFSLELDLLVLLFAIGLSTVTGLIFGLVPAWLISRVRVGETLKSGARGNTATRAQHRFRHGLIVAQFALALVLLAGAGVFLRGMHRMLTSEVGWDQTSLLQGVLSLPQNKYGTPEQAYAFYLSLQEQLGTLPGVESVAVGWTLPIFQFLTTRNYIAEGQEAPPAGREPMAFVNGVSPSFLATLNISLLAGRNFTAADTLSAPDVAIINESMARAL